MPVRSIPGSPTTIIIPGDLRRRARAFQAAQGVSLSEQIRRGLEEFLASRGFPAAKSAPEILHP